jgi:hypothetical protein
MFIYLGMIIVVGPSSHNTASSPAFGFTSTTSRNKKPPARASISAARTSQELQDRLTTFDRVNAPQLISCDIMPRCVVVPMNNHSTCPTNWMLTHLVAYQRKTVPRRLKMRRYVP